MYPQNKIFILILMGHTQTTQSHILYRNKNTQTRQKKAKRHKSHIVKLDTLN